MNAINTSGAHRDSLLRLNLGCARNMLPGYINVDVVPGTGITVADLRLDWPWDTCSVGDIQASHVIEHLPDKIHTMNELWRVLAPGARATIAVPTTGGPAAWSDPTHVSYWNERSFGYYESSNAYRETYAALYGINASFAIVSRRLEPTVDGPILHLVLAAVKPVETRPS